MAAKFVATASAEMFAGSVSEARFAHMEEIEVFASCAAAARCAFTAKGGLCAKLAAGVRFARTTGGVRLAEIVAALKFVFTVGKNTIVGIAAGLQFVSTTLGKTGARFVWKEGPQQLDLPWKVVNVDFPSCLVSGKRKRRIVHFEKDQQQLAVLDLRWL